MVMTQIEEEQKVVGDLAALIAGEIEVGDFHDRHAVRESEARLRVYSEGKDCINLVVDGRRVRVELTFGSYV